MSRMGVFVIACVAGVAIEVGPSSIAAERAPGPQSAAVSPAPLPSPVQSGEDGGHVEAALHRLQASPDSELRDYRARRRLHAVNRRFKAEAWMDVVTELTPLGAFRYEIVAERGSESVRGKVLRKVLETEGSMWRHGDIARAALTDENYTFAPLDAPAPETSAAAPSAAEWFVTMTPKRRDTRLVAGRLVLDAATGDLRRIEGRVAKSPSFWTSRVEIVRRYGRVNGVRVPLFTASVADVKIAGRSEFDMTYEYERINGIDVLPDALASTSAP